jgi:adenylate cyclase
MAVNELVGCVTEAGLIARTERELMADFCRRVVGSLVPAFCLLVAASFSTLHPVSEGGAFRSRTNPDEAVQALDYGRANEGEAAENWRRGLSFTGCGRVETKMRRRLVSIGR